MRHRFYQSQEAIFTAGDQGNSMFILVEGLLGVRAVLEDSGEERGIAQIAPGHFFGEMSLLTGEPRSATVVAITSAVAFEITHEDLDALFKVRPEIMEKLSEVVAERRLRNIQTSSAMSAKEQDRQIASVAKQLLGKIRTFFGSSS